MLKMLNAIPIYMEANVAEQMFGTTDMCEWFEVSRQTVLDWIRDGKFPNYQHIGRDFTVPASDIISYVNAEIEGLESEIKSLEDIKLDIAERSVASG